MGTDNKQTQNATLTAVGKGLNGKGRRRRLYFSQAAREGPEFKLTPED